MKRPANPLLAYYHQCFVEDVGRLQLSNTTGRRPALHGEVVDADFFGRPGALFPIPTVQGRAVAEHLQKHAHEEALCVWLFALDTSSVLQKVKAENVRLPLVLYEAELVALDEAYFLSIDLSLPIINEACIHNLKSNFDASLDEVVECLRPSSWKDVAVDQLHEAVERSLPQLTSLLSGNFETFLKPVSAVGADHQPNTLLPLAGWCIVRRSKASAGLVRELEALPQLGNLSAPVKFLLGSSNSTSKTKRKSSRPLMVSTSLSNRQESIVRSTTDHVLTRVIGPPGTGKSFTCGAIASQAFATGEKVLILAKSAEALDAVAEKLATEFELVDYVVRTERFSSRVELKRRLKWVLNQMGVPNIDTDDQRLSLAIMASELRGIKQKSKRFGAAQSAAVRGSSRLTKALNRWFYKATLLFVKAQAAVSPTLTETSRSLLAQEDQFFKAVAASHRLVYHRRLHELLRKHYEALRTFSEALSSKRGLHREQLFGTLRIQVLLNALPIWTATPRDLHKVLPFQPEIFDLVVVDEASQLDMASVLPALYRAKRAVVVGDPFQLRHVSFISTAFQAAQAKRLKLTGFSPRVLDYRNVSLLDLAELRSKDNAGLYMLDEHFRSQPEIIAFSNVTYYGHSLKVMTRGVSLPTLNPVQFTRVKGTLGKNGVNLQEVDLILRAVLRFIQSQRKQERVDRPSIGILSPFRKQADELARRLVRSVPNHLWTTHRLKVGTPYDWQGQERDCMFISVALDNHASPAAWRYLKKTGVLNVSITRARSTQFIYHSFAPESLAPEEPIAAFFNFHHDTRTSVTPIESPLQLAFVYAVAATLDTFGGLTYRQDVLLAGQRIDFLCETVEGKVIALDLTYTPGNRGQILDLHAVRALRRIGISVRYLSYLDWPEDRKLWHSLMAKLLT